MDKKVACVTLFCFALANAEIIPLQPGNILQGPSTRTKVIGPDGSIIDAYAPGGKIVLEGDTGPLLQPAPVVYSQAAVVEPQVYSPISVQQLVLAEHNSNSVEAVAPVQKVVADSISVEASKISRVSEDGQKVFLHPGTPERVETREFVPVTEDSEETATPTTETATIESFTEDLSGTYVPDNFERLFDDGSYRPEHF
ncbi:uncharacterized protein LOC109540624 [Dendroctonus ponderosae]